MQLTLDSKLVDDVVVIRCHGRIVAGAEIAALQAELDKQTVYVKMAVLHLADVDYIDSSGLGRRSSTSASACSHSSGLSAVGRLTCGHHAQAHAECNAGAVSLPCSVRFGVKRALSSSSATSVTSLLEPGSVRQQP